MTTDPQYEYRTCPGCQQQWQLIDWNCARHQLHCGYPAPKPTLPDNVEWRGFDERQRQ